jgi:hypothetical protein
LIIRPTPHAAILASRAASATAAMKSWSRGSQETARNRAELSGITSIPDVAFRENLRSKEMMDDG